MRFLSFLLLVTPYLTDPASGASNAQSLLKSLDEVPVLHFTLSRRGGVFTATVPGNDWVNLPYLTQELDRTECRFNLTKREAKGNKLVRKAKADETGGRESRTLMGDIASNGTWYVGFVIILSIGALDSSSNSLDQVRKAQNRRTPTGDRNGPQHACIRFLRNNHFEQEWQQVR